MLVPINHLIGPFLLNPPQGSKDVQINPIFFAHISLHVLNDRTSFAFYQFHIYYSSYGTYTGGPHLRYHQIMPRRPKISITGKRGEHVQKTCYDGLYILYTCISGYVHTLIFNF